LATTARHECLRLIRRAGRVVPAGDDVALDPPDTEAAPPDTALLVGERDAALLAALDRLSEKCRRLLRVLMADPEPSYEQVGAALDMPIGSIGPTRGRCLQHLRRQLTGISGADRGSQPA
jgi:DNA-directed RNA polymerase specialized sigma24 family protein